MGKRFNEIIYVKSLDIDVRYFYCYTIFPISKTSLTKSTALRALAAWEPAQLIIYRFSFNLNFYRNSSEPFGK